MEVGEYYKHFKGKNIYKILATNVTYTGESAGVELKDLVVYQNIIDKKIFVREYTELTEELSKEKHLILVCGHYEGFDERIRSLCDLELSVGDFILTGGEIPSMLIADSIIRLIPGVIEEESHLKESFNNNLLDYPEYTKPRIYNCMEVPEVLLSGDHKKIDAYRLEESIKRTKIRRPDLLEK